MFVWHIEYRIVVAKQESAITISDMVSCTIVFNKSCFSLSKLKTIKHSVMDWCRNPNYALQLVKLISKLYYPPININKIILEPSNVKYEWIFKTDF